MKLGIVIYSSHAETGYPSLRHLPQAATFGGHGFARSPRCRISTKWCGILTKWFRSEMQPASIYI